MFLPCRSARHSRKEAFKNLLHANRGSYRLRHNKFPEEDGLSVRHRLVKGVPDDACKTSAVFVHKWGSNELRLGFHISSGRSGPG